MGSMFSRYMRDLSEVAGCDISDGPVVASTPTRPVQTMRVLNLDPRSPTAEIVRTPIEVAPFQHRELDDSPSTFMLSGRRSYLETDLDSLMTKELDCRPVADFSPGQVKAVSPAGGLPPSHLLKLRFLGIDPRSPSSEVIRTPIQVPSSEERVIRKFHFDDSLSLGSVSSQDISRTSTCLSDFSRDFTDPSVIVSECEDDISEQNNSVPIPKVDSTPEHHGVETPIREPIEAVNSSIISPIKNSAKLTVFCEEEADSLINIDKKLSSTPELTATKKNVRNNARTPLTPLCNRNSTPNSIIRAKQSQGIEREKLTKVKIFNGAEKIKTTSQVVQSSSTPLKNDHKLSAQNDENTPLRDGRAQWDHDTSILI